VAAFLPHDRLECVHQFGREEAGLLGEVEESEAEEAVDAPE